MLSHRYTHYWLWFLLFGLVGGLLYYNKHKGLDAESTWLLASGLLGILFGTNWINGGKWARTYDIIIGVIIGGVGIVGILVGFGILHITGTKGIINSNSILGLSLLSFAPLIHTVLGFTSLNHGIKNNK